MTKLDDAKEIISALNQRLAVMDMGSDTLWIVKAMRLLVTHCEDMFCWSKQAAMKDRDLEFRVEKAVSIIEEGWTRLEQRMVDHREKLRAAQIARSDIRHEIRKLRAEVEVLKTVAGETSVVIHGTPLNHVSVKPWTVANIEDAAKVLLEDDEPKGKDDDEEDED